ncbi:NUDIX domain-containing protein [Aliikangiella maris]|uniref:NUDIX domain-containing protein n=2 Tax=Aliikangiella maris TaxID=3162458 RepID=A0ABV3MMY9_9GAMM
MKYTSIVSGLFEQNNSVLLCLRKNTRHFPGFWTFPVGHVEKSENLEDALRRELYEELGIQLIDCESLMTLIDNQENIRHTIFRVTDWRGKIDNKEPELCAQIEWFDLAQLPTPITPWCLTVINSL